MKDWFNGLAQREQRLILAMLGVVIIAIVFFALIQPLQERVARAELSVKRNQQLLSWVETNAAKIVQLRAKGGVSASASGSIEQRINRSARQYKITINRLQPQNKKMQVMIDKAPFNSILQWVQALQLKQGLTIEIADIRADAQSGYVKTRLVVSQ
ncbi:type II secretion system protein M [Psychrobium sp. MM17-31]|uniref:type II secretion system protein GspM n=1 Tax=Psychrobium sp. MM17-31 TaxID=2917758 RepID=UPI001EF4D437|nr:type II secretion system protein M [Psychrobium sp. MM17-31]MCG7532204.1 type II secretion system protein M [Psychrobium sp. MM17-31]